MKVPGSFSPGADSPFMLQDMAGNVWEWTADWYAEEYYLQQISKNPAGPDNGNEKVLRGGYWLSNAWAMRASNRHHDDPDVGQQNFGFRCAMDE